MERRNNGNDRIQLPEPKRMDTRKYTRQKTTGQNNSKGYHNSTERTSRTTTQKKKAKTEGRKSHRQATENAPLAQKKNARRRTRISAPASLASPTPTSYRERPESSLPSSRRRSRLGRLSSFFRLTHLIRVFFVVFVFLLKKNNNSLCFAFCPFLFCVIITS